MARKDPLQAVIEFHNRLVEYEAYDSAHLLHPDAKHIENDDVLAWMRDFKAVDDIYVEYSECLDFTLKIKAEMTREPFHEGISKLAKKAKRAGKSGAPPWGTKELVDTIGFKRLIGFVNDMRDIAREQIERYEAVLGKNVFGREGKK